MADLLGLQLPEDAKFGITYFVSIALPARTLFRVLPHIGLATLAKSSDY